MHEPFRCVDCGALSVAATECSLCGSRSFSLAKIPEPAGVAAEPQPRPPAQLYSLQAARIERDRRRTGTDSD